MIFFYLVALIPILIGMSLWHKDKRVVWWEWLSSCALVLLTAGLFNWIAFESKCQDHEILSGIMISAAHYPYWQSRVKVEDYKTETYTTGSGSNKQTHSRQVYVGYHYEYSNHPERWGCSADYGIYGGVKDYDIDIKFFEEIANKFCNGKLRTVTPHKSNFYKGDKNIYVADNNERYVYPTTTWKSFKNKVKACTSLYSYAPVPTNAVVFAYPSCSSPFKSDRLLGTAKQTITIREFDLLCSKIGPLKKVNLIIIGFGDVGSENAQFQEAQFIGGRKNDLVLCYGGSDPLKPSWTYVFGWTDTEIVKQNLQTIMLNNPMDQTILPLIEEEIKSRYEIKEWRDFDYMQIDPPKWTYWVYLFVLILTQGGFWYWAITNGVNEYGTMTYNGY
jgi:hypothetical protein